MKYTSEITNKDISDGLLTVQVRFTSEDRSVIVQDAFSTRSPQDPDWLINAINRKASELEGLDAFIETIPIGEVAGVIPAQPVEDTPRQAYEKDLQTFNKLVSILRQGFIEADNADFVAVQQRLKDNFDSSYIDLF